MKEEKLARGFLTLFFSVVLMLGAVAARAQRASWQKMSPLVKLAVLEHEQSGARRAPGVRAGGGELCAFVRLAAGADSVLAAHGCRCLARVGDIVIANIPLGGLSGLSAERGVLRIEAGQRCTALMDSVPQCVNATAAYTGQGLPQAFTGRGVVVGVQDVGFDLTHPNFFDATGTNYRICRFWDQLSTDTVGSSLYVGAEYVGREALLAYAHSRDGLDQTHGTHTAGTAAGSGFDTRYRGMAFESDLFLVNNAVTADTAFIAPDDRYKYTSATDALGFKYLLDHAAELGQPCVVSFSEGSHQDFSGDDQLLYEVLDGLVGPGRIIVAAAGNNGGQANHLCKPVGVAEASSYVYGGSRGAYLFARATAPFDFQLVFSETSQGVQTFNVPSWLVFEQADSVLTVKIEVDEETYDVLIAGYPSCFNPHEMAYELLISHGGKSVGGKPRLTLGARGSEARVDFFPVVGAFLNSSRGTEPEGYTDEAYGIHSPGSAPAVICVGATSYRTQIVNYKGEVRAFDHGTGGVRAPYSSVGPSYAERIKPDVMAPGSNVISSYSSWYLEAHPDAFDIQQDVAHFEWNGRTYAWNSDGGTSMSTPVVSGAIALWLQANPTLTPDDVRDVLAATCKRYDPSMDYPNNYYGWGEIDVYRGLLYVLNLTGIDGLNHHQPSGVTFSLHDGCLRMAFASQPVRPFTLRLFAVSGRELRQVAFEPGSTAYEADLRFLPPGVYAVQLQSAETAVAGSTLIRL